MERFVAGNRAALQDHIQRHQEVHVVMGNEACDLDSTVSALALAYFLAKTSSAPATTFVPVLNIPRAELPLRTETVFLLGEQGIPPTSLICRDEIDLGGLHGAGLLSLTLVDHHVLTGTDAALEEAVVEVLDHRPLDRDRAPRCPMTVAPVGSCATLVTERIAQGPPGVLDRVTAALLHGTILLDCINLSPAAGKATPRDVACVSLLEERFPDLPARDKVFEALQAAKFDVSGLTTEQMLRKDLKVLPGEDLLLAISGIYVDLETFLHRPGFLQDLEAFCQAQGYAGLVAMTISFNQQLEPSRQLAVYSPRQPLRSAVCRALEEASEPALNLRPLPSPWSCLAAYTQGNSWASRKKVLPILRAALGGGSGGCRGGPGGGGGPPTHPHEQLGGGMPAGTARAPPLPPGRPGAGQPHRCRAAPWLPQMRGGG